MKARVTLEFRVGEKVTVKELESEMRRLVLAMHPDAFTPPGYLEPYGAAYPEDEDLLTEHIETTYTLGE